MKTSVLNITPGQIVKYHDEPCMVLEHRQDGTLLMVIDQIKYTFGPSNNFAASPLRTHLDNNFLDSITEGHPDEIITRTVDLTALNGSTEYGTVDCKVAPLSFDELRKYHDILPLPEEVDWSVTPWSIPKVGENDKWVLSRTSNGEIAFNNSKGGHGCHPAFLIPSTFTVEVDDEDQKARTPSNPLERYSAKELVNELIRRINKQ